MGEETGVAEGKGVRVAQGTGRGVEMGTGPEVAVPGAVAAGHIAVGDGGKVPAIGRASVGGASAVSAEVGAFVPGAAVGSALQASRRAREMKGNTSAGPVTKLRKENRARGRTMCTYVLP